MEERRPDPEALLKRAQEEEIQKKRGKLKIFFGATAGVGKTYAMLLAGQQKRTEGLEVVVGYVETHRRKETEALVQGLEVLPRRVIDYQGKKMEEFDLDGALARKPSLILVDELAHTNVTPSRHKKRWQDVNELIEAGINVYTTLNVQHLESLNDVVSQITGIIMRETVPDSLFDQAEELELIDLPPDDLIQRLREGKVYLGDQAARAIENFFRKGNLMALRELALRRTAERVEEQMQSYRQGLGVRTIWPAAERFLVCVGPNPRSIRLIRAARNMAAGLHATWIAVHVDAPSKTRLTETEIKQVAGHLRLAESLGAETVMLSGLRESEEVLNYARTRNVSKIIVGKPTHPRWRDKLFGSFLNEIVRGSGDIDVYVITGDSAGGIPKPAGKFTKKRSRKREWVLSILGVAFCTSLAALMFPYFALVDLVMVYLLGLVFTASMVSRGPSLFATLLSITALDFFFIPPYYSFAVTDIKYFITFIVMFAVAFIISGLTLRTREQAEAARLRERRTAALYGLSRDLVQERKKERLGEIAAKHISALFASQVVILIPSEEGKLTQLAASPLNFSIDEKESSVAQWVYNNQKPAGLGTDTLPSAKSLYLPLIASSGTVGVVGIQPETIVESFDPAQFHLLESFANQSATAIERAFLAKQAHTAMVQAEKEALRNTLLSSVSHDLRTPLSAITGAVTTLLQKSAALDSATRLDLLETIQEEADHLNRIIRNVLDMMRLESGAVTIKKEWQSLEEIVGLVLNRLSEKLRDYSLTTHLPRSLPLILCDGVLLEQVLMNLFENAIKYTPSGSPLELSASVQEKTILVELADRGPGIPSGQLENIFQKFVRGHLHGEGAGLGLAICRSIIAAHGGRIWAENRQGGGAIFRFTLPVEGQPSMPQQEMDV
jgi:two-component system sensor histidine kinase KdpD